MINIILNQVGNGIRSDFFVNQQIIEIKAVSACINFFFSKASKPINIRMIRTGS